MRYAGPLAALLIVLEIAAAIAVADATSWGAMILLLIVLSLVGASLVRRETVAAVRGARGASGGTPAAAATAMADGAVRVGGGLLVLVPGFVTGVVGLVLLLPPVRLAVRHWVGPRWARRMPAVVLRRTGLRPESSPYARDHEVVDGEIADPIVTPVEERPTHDVPRNDDDRRLP